MNSTPVRDYSDVRCPSCTLWFCPHFEAQTESRSRTFRCPECSRIFVIDDRDRSPPDTPSR